MKKTETIFSKETKYAHKSKLNRLPRPVEQGVLDKIEAGITIEGIDELIKSGLPVLKYKTQITIHGLFPELSTNSIFGYKNIFQNKNKSIGVKYNAIDEQKRRVIAERLSLLGFRYSRNSTETSYQIVKAVDHVNYLEVYNHLKELHGKIDTSLFFGGCSLWAGEAWGQKYLVLEIVINAIYEKNIEPFLNKAGATKELLQQTREQEKREREERARQWEAEKRERARYRQQQIEEHANEINRLNLLDKTVKTTKPGVYVNYIFDSNDNLKFAVMSIYMEPRARKPRFTRAVLKTLDEALNYRPEPSYGDGILKSGITGYKVVSAH